MNFVRGGFADLTGRRVGVFTVQQIHSRDRNRAPVWTVTCSECGRQQFFQHAKLTNALESHAAQQVLTCQNAGCRHSQTQVIRTESLSDIRRAEREEQTRAEYAAKAQREEAEKQVVKDAALRAEKQRYLKFANAQINAGVPVGSERFMTFERWLLQGKDWQDDMLSKISGGMD